MRRIFTMAAIAAAMTIPASVAAVGVVNAGTAGAASAISCTGLKGTISGNITISKCNPSGGKAFKSASAPASSLATGGTLTWKPYKHSVNTTTVSLSVTSPGQGACKAGYDEYDATGSVTAETGASGVGIPVVGDTVSARACVDSTNGKIELVKHTSFTL
jgi:hypothetical protein